MMRYSVSLSASLVMILAVSGPVAAQSTLDKNAQRIVRDATRDLKNKDAVKRTDAVDKLASWGGAQTLPLVIGALKDSDARVRAAAAEALWSEKMKSESARPALMAALDDSSPNVVVMAAGALGVLGVTPAELRKPNERALAAGTDVRVRFLAARGLIGVVPPAPLAPPLVAYLERQASADSSSGLQTAHDALDRLVAINDPTVVAPLVAAATALGRGADVLLEVLGKVRPRPDGWTALLVAQTGRPDVPTRRRAVSLMGDLKADAEVAQWAPLAARLLATDSDSGVRGNAARSLGSAAGAAHPHAVVVLAAARRDVDASVRESAFSALSAIVGRLGTAPMSVKTAMAKTAQLEILAAIESDSDEDVREEAVDALDALGLDPAVAASLLVKLAASPTASEDIRTQALAKLRNRGPEARSVASEVQKLQTDANAAVRSAATVALGQIEARSPVPNRQLPVPRPAARGAVSAAPAAMDSRVEARGLAVLRSNNVEFHEDQFFKALGDLNLDVSRAFLDAGMSANLRFRTQSETPLSVALQRQACSPEARPTAASTRLLVQLLVDRGADASLADVNGNTALMAAAMAGCDKVIMSALIKAGANLNARNQAGLTAFEFGLFAAHDGLDAIIAAGYRLPADKAKVYLDAYKANPKAIDLIKRATP